MDSLTRTRTLSSSSSTSSSSTTTYTELAPLFRVRANDIPNIPLPPSRRPSQSSFASAFDWSLPTFSHASPVNDEHLSFHASDAIEGDVHQTMGLRFRDDNDGVRHVRPPLMRTTNIDIDGVPLSRNVATWTPPRGYYDYSDDGDGDDDYDYDYDYNYFDYSEHETDSGANDSDSESESESESWSTSANASGPAADADAQGTPQPPRPISPPVPCTEAEGRRRRRIPLREGPHDEIVRMVPEPGRILDLVWWPADYPRDLLEDLYKEYR
ncbi:hypothetical protein LTR43_005576 [Exophiala xenobiotica]